MRRCVFKLAFDATRCAIQFHGGVFLAAVLSFVICSSVSAENYVANDACKDCHAEAYAQWQGSHHQLAMQHATAQSVLGDFNSASFKYFDLTSRFFRKGEEFFVNTEGPDGKLRDYKIKYTFGVDPLQQYLIEFPGGRLQSLTMAWDTKKKRWFHLYPNERIKADDPLHWTKLYQNWNMMCGECHTTNYQKNYDAKTGSYRTAWSEINVSCQSCHGPGQQHVDWAQQRARGQPSAVRNAGLAVDVSARAPNTVEVEVCAQCHSRRTSLKSGHHAGDRFLDGFLPATLSDGLYHPDGQINDEVYEYGSFVQSKMYHAGVKCSDCHNTHSLKLKTEVNQVCVACHRSEPPIRFATLKKKNYDSREHHHHPDGSTGTRCVSCHMPTKTYMGVDSRHDHSLRVPRPDLTSSIKTPNACNGCHADKSASWAAQKVSEWYGVARAGTPHYGGVIAAVRAGATDHKALIALVANKDTPTFVRATVVELLGPADQTSLQTLLDLAYGDEPLLRHAALGALEALPPQQRFSAAASLLSDDVALVRGEAARVLADVPADRFGAKQSAAFRKALGEYRSQQEYAADMPSAQLNLAVLDNKLGDSTAALQHYERALQLDAYFLPARFNLANYYNSVGDNERAIGVLRDGIKLIPDNGELYYSLGLIYGELRRLQDAAAALGKAADLQPERGRVRYNYALALQGLGQEFAAATELRKAYKVDKRDPDIVYALAALHAQRNEWREALPYARRLVELLPKEPNAQQLLSDIEQRAAK